jgi:DNA-directed RNA polymerase specialized sigma24 family protein
MTDEELISAVARGDEDAFNELYRRYALRLFKYACRRASYEDAEEIVQDVFFESLYLRAVAAHQFELGAIAAPTIAR